MHRHAERGEQAAELGAAVDGAQRDARNWQRGAAGVGGGQLRGAARLARSAGPDEPDHVAVAAAHGAHRDALRERARDDRLEVVRGRERHEVVDGLVDEIGGELGRQPGGGERVDRLVGIGRQRGVGRGGPRVD